MEKSTLHETLEKAAAFVLLHRDVITNVSQSILYNDEPQLFSFFATYPASKKREDMYDYSAGVSFIKNIALLRALCEGMERYCLDNLKLPIAATSSIKKVKKSHLDPKIFSPFSSSQLANLKFRQFRINENSQFRWIEAESLSTGERKLLPAQLATYNYQYLDKEPLITIPLSTGVATGNSLEDALQRAILEIVERDAYMISYLNKLPSPSIELNQIKSKKIKRVISTFKRYRLELTLVDITTDIEIPSFAAITIDRTGLGPAVSVGLKAGFDEEAAMISAIEESLMTRSWVRDKFAYSEVSTKKLKKILNIDDRARLWFSREMVEKLDFWLEGNKKKTLQFKKKNTKRGLDFIKRIFEEKNMEILYVDITDKKIKEAGFAVVRVIIPQLQQLYLDERHPFLGGSRLYTVPVKLGYLSKPHLEYELNKIPHPFL
ncbi:MAG TPA: YcaO-like family protein [Patescibacteria group bacterium]